MKAPLPAPTSGAMHAQPSRPLSIRASMPSSPMTSTTSSTRLANSAPRACSKTIACSMPTTSLTSTPYSVWAGVPRCSTLPNSMPHRLPVPSTARTSHTVSSTPARNSTRHSSKWRVKTAGVSTRLSRPTSSLFRFPCAYRKARPSMAMPGTSAPRFLRVPRSVS